MAGVEVSNQKRKGIVGVPGIRMIVMVMMIMIMMWITALSIQNLAMVLVVITISTRKEARRIVTPGPEMETRRRMSIEALGAAGMGREIRTEMMRTSMEGSETENVTVKGTGRKRAHGEAEVNPKGVRVILMTEKERGVVTGSIETVKGAGIRITETGKGQGNPGNGIEKAGPSNLRTAINPNWRCCFNIRFCFICRRHKEKKEEAAEPEVDPERDQRTVFAYQISLKADERDVYEFFSRAGKVRDVRLIMDRNSRRSKGVGYIEFYDVMSVPMAIALSGQFLLGQPVMVKPSEAEKNLVQSTTSVATGPAGVIGPYSGGARRLYVGNLHFNMTETDLRTVFEAFGQVELVQLPLDESGNCKGFGFVQFARLEDARNAQSLNGQLEIGGRTIKVSAITDQSGMQEVGGNTGDLDDDEGGGLSLNASSRALLMQKLNRSGTAPSMTGSAGNAAVNVTGLNMPATVGSPLSSIPTVPGLPGGGLQVPTPTISSIDTIGVPSECLLLKNMFDPKDEKEPDFDLDIKEDVEAECSKFGKLKHIFVDKNSAGSVYLRFENTQSAISAQRALHGRWFAGKMITASFMVPQTYEDKFPDSR
ncbi:uncharacterized protein LOC107467320 isoform X4 [Arachis duranensis]|uniref:Uncharacterized protein LOC107467320 isoform X4 n=1 Tax=Arachis duranensis TaxID=130453 RepID=A0A9C6WMX6_ARADU|nr:uncharacterized protein LOC107467320 isoform X4 [Arachis duranensis]